MAKKIQILIMIFCLGIFIFPKQVFLSTIEKSDCCKTEKSCCNKNQSEKKDCHKQEKDKNSCEGNCANCHSCCSVLVFNIENKNIFEATNTQKFTSRKVEIYYLQPHLSSLFISIWQPPKIS